MKFNYTYIIKDIKTNEFYIGVRSSNKKPQDDEYMGSMKTWVRMEGFNKNNLRKTILSTYETREEACKVENELIKLFINDPLNRNYYIPDMKFHTNGLSGEKSGTFGRKHSDETKRIMSELAKNRIASNKKMVLDLDSGIYYSTIKEYWTALHNKIPFGTFYHRYKNRNYKNLVII